MIFYKLHIMSQLLCISVQSLDGSPVDTPNIVTLNGTFHREYFQVLAFDNLHRFFLVLLNCLNRCTVCHLLRIFPNIRFHNSKHHREKYIFLESEKKKNHESVCSIANQKQGISSVYCNYWKKLNVEVANM